MSIENRRLGNNFEAVSILKRITCSQGGEYGESIAPTQMTSSKSSDADDRQTKTDVGGCRVYRLLQTFFLKFAHTLIFLQFVAKTDALENRCCPCLNPPNPLSRKALEAF